MTTPDGIGPERLAEIVDGAAPHDEDERALLALMEETRALEPGASQELRRRVLDGPASQAAPGRRDPRRWLASTRNRRGLLVGAPVVAGIIALAIAIPAMNGGSPSPSPAPADSAAVAGTAAAPQRARSAGGAEATPAPAADSAGVPAVGAKAQAPTADSGRAQQVTATTRVQVKDVAGLSRASTGAMRTVRGLGGFTASSDYAVPNGGEGTNHLVFRVPVDRAGDALAAFGRLGVVTGQNASIVDLTARLDAAAWTLGALVLVGPFLLLAGLAGWGVLRLRGRSERRLMGSV